MTTAQHQQTVNSAIRTGDELARLFARVGGSDAPKGRILRAYRTARDLLSVDEMVRQQQVTTFVLTKLRDDVQTETLVLLFDALALGAEQAEAQLSAYGIDAESGAPADTEWRESFILAAVASVVSTINAQIGQVMALLASGAITATQVIGDGVRLGILNPTPVLTQSRDVIAKAAQAAWGAQMVRLGRNQWRQQAIAAIDERTTDCCLRVHGVSVAMRAPFHLTGTPRFADYLAGPPFHWHCRTALALVLATDADDDLTQRMRAAAKRELAIRRLVRMSGAQRGETRPVNAFGGGG